MVEVFVFLNIKLLCEAADCSLVASCESRRAEVDKPNDSHTSKQTHLNIKLYHIIN